MAAQTSAGKAKRGQSQGRKEKTRVASETFSADEGAMEDLALKECERQEETPKPRPLSGCRGHGSCGLQRYKPSENVFFAFLSKDLVR